MPGSPKPKTVSAEVILGQQGINLIERHVLAMRSIWTPIGSIDVGIDGVVELCNPMTGEALGQIVRVQGKATDQAWDDENEEQFSYRCKQRDLDHWLCGNAPVVLIVCRPSTGEAYWVSIKDYFRDAGRRAKRVVLFSKGRDRFNADAFTTLLTVAARPDSGLYLAPQLRDERLYSNLLQVTTYGPTLYVAETPHVRNSEIWEKLHEVDEDPGGEWFIKEGRLWSFHDLREFPWTREDFGAGEWALSDDGERRRDFVRLIGSSLKQLLYPEVRWRKEQHCFYFTLPNGNRSRSISYESHARGSKRTVVAQYPRKVDGQVVTLYGHNAFWRRFRRFDEVWYLEISPTYVFTHNGRDVAYQHEEWVKGIKRKERNRAVTAQLLLWSQYIARLGRETMFEPAYPFLQLGDLAPFDLEVGIDDAAWQKTEDDAEAEVLKDLANRVPLPGLDISAGIDEPDQIATGDTVNDLNEEA